MFSFLFFQSLIMRLPPGPMTSDEDEQDISKALYAVEVSLGRKKQSLEELFPDRRCPYSTPRLL